MTTRVLLLYNNLNAISSPDSQNSSQPSEAIMDDSLICGILERAPQEDSDIGDEMYYTSTSIIEKCIEISGVEARMSLAKFFPYYCLTDPNVEVRRIAIESIGHFPELVYKYYNEVLLWSVCRAALTPSLEMRVPGSEAHIEIGLADLYIAAAPALQLLSLHNVIYVPQCMIYLIEGMELSIVNDLMSTPHRSLIQALHTIYSSIDPQYMQSILAAISSHNPKYLDILYQWCPEWAAPRGYSPSVQAYQQAAQGKKEEAAQSAPLHAEQPVEAAPAPDSWTIYWSKVKEAQQKGPAGYLESLEYISIMRAYETNQARQQLLGNYLMATLLPTISAYYLPQLGSNKQFVFTDVILANASSVLQVIHYVSSLCPQEANYLLHTDDMVQQLLLAVKQTQKDPLFVAAVEQQAAQLFALPSQSLADAHSAPLPSGQQQQQQQQQEATLSQTPRVTFLLPAEKSDVDFGNVEGYGQPAEGAAQKQGADGSLRSVRSEELVFPDVKVPNTQVVTQTSRLEMLGIAGSVAMSGRREEAA